MFKRKTLPVMMRMTMLAPALLAGCVTSTESDIPTSAKPATASQGQVDRDTGISKDALIQVFGLGDGDTTLYGIFYKQDRIDPAQLKAAPAKLCAAKKQTLVSGEDKALEHPDSLPGTRKMMVRCK